MEVTTDDGGHWRQKKCCDVVRDDCMTVSLEDRDLKGTAWLSESRGSGRVQRRAHKDMQMQRRTRRFRSSTNFLRMSRSSSLWL